MAALLSPWILIALATINAESINWNGQNWAMSCDFKGRDLRNVTGKWEQCNGECERESQCSHFAWSRWRGGTCWLKTGSITKNDAIVACEPTVVCGIVVRSNCANGAQCNPPCTRPRCCSQPGQCGNAVQRCAGSPCQLSKPRRTMNYNLVSEHQFNCIFDQLDQQTCRQRWQGFQEAIRQVTFRPQNQNEMMMFLAHASYETNGLKTYEECCITRGTCATNYNEANWCGSIQGMPGKQYYGRGWFQLAYPCNYHAAGQALGVDLWGNPEQVASSDKIASATGLWYWNERKMNVPAREGNFAETTRIINSNECGLTAQQGARIECYQKVRRCFSLPPQSINLRC